VGWSVSVAVWMLGLVGRLLVQLLVPVLIVVLTSATGHQALLVM
jgi:hypothetical protein